MLNLLHTALPTNTGAIHKNKIYKTIFPTDAVISNLYRSLSLQHRKYGLYQYLNIQTNTEIHNIFIIQSNNFFKIRNLTTPGYLPHTCKSWFHSKTALMVLIILIIFIHCWRSCPNQTHIALQHIDQLRQLMGTVRENFDLTKVVEYTVEAGRPDCTDAEKLAVIKEYGATRISINPQTFSDEVLAGIGRKHSAQDIRDCYADARKAGHEDINMDLIAGLPGDTVEGFEHSLRQAIALQPENITVHTLTLKRASRIVIEDQKENDYADVAAMLEKCHLLAEAGYRPYYLYRQKNTLQNLENVGWCKPGHEGYYNIYIMEEVQTILSAGAGGSTKLVADGGKRMQRIFNFKYPNEYIQRFAEVLERKKGVADFYDHDLGTQTSG